MKFCNVGFQRAVLLDDTKLYYAQHKRYYSGSQRKEDFFIVEYLQSKGGRLNSEVFGEVNLTASLQRRDRHDIVAEILETARDGQKKTCIMYKARLSHSQLKYYLSLLNRSGLIMNDDGVYRTTPKGLVFIREFEEVNFLFRQ